MTSTGLAKDNKRRAAARPILAIPPKTTSRLIRATSPRSKEWILRAKYTTSIRVICLEKSTRSLPGRIEKVSIPRESEIAEDQDIELASAEPG